MDQAEASGKTVEDALNRALAQLGARRDQVEFVVLDEGRKGGLFGRGAKEARVRVERTSGSAEPMPAPPPDTRIPRGNEQGAPRGSRGGANRGGRGSERGGGDRNRAQGSDRPPRQAASGERAGEAAQPRGARNRGSGRSQTRTGFDSAAPKLTDADFLKPRAYAEGEAPPEGSAPAPRSQRPPRDRGGNGSRDNAPRDRGDRPERRHRDDEPHIAPDINAEEVDFAAQTVDDVLRILDIDAELSIREPVTAGDGLGAALAVIDIKGEDLGLLIGRRGETLLSLQYLVNLALSKRFPGKGGVTIDVEHYRHRREEQVVSLAKRMADRVRETGSPITLEPMSASERRLVHLLFAEDGELETNSIGEGDNRKVVISARR